MLDENDKWTRLYEEVIVKSKQSLVYPYLEKWL
jgi:hypothetical protein